MADFKQRIIEIAQEINRLEILTIQTNSKDFLDDELQGLLGQIQKLSKKKRIALVSSINVA